MFTRGSFRYPYIVRLMGTGSFLCLASIAGGTQVGDFIPTYLLIFILVLNYWMIGSNLSTIFLFFISDGNSISLWYILNLYYMLLSSVEFFLAVCGLVLKYDKFIIRKSKICLIFGSISSIKLECMSGTLVSFEFNWNLEVCVCMCVLIFYFFVPFFVLFLFMFFNFCCNGFFY